MDKIEKERRKEKERQAALRDATIANAGKEAIERYGRAASEHIKAYTGFEWNNQATGQSGVAKGLRDIADSKVHPDFEYQNMKQQAGFSAEIKYTANKNAENMIKGKNARYRRANDVGLGNDQHNDVGEVGADGSFCHNADGTVKGGAQIKFVGNYKTEGDIIHSAHKNVDHLAGNGKWAKYQNDDVLVPSEQYQEMRAYAARRSSELLKQADKFERQGKNLEATELREKAERYQKAGRHIKNSHISSREAMDYRRQPGWETTKDVLKTANRAGLEQLGTGAIIGGVVATAQSLVHIINGEQEPSEAVGEVAKGMAVGGGAAYAMTAAGTIIKGSMQSMSNQTVQALSKTNLPAMIATGVYQIGRSFYRFAKGEIDAVELAVELGEKGVGAMASSWGAAVGTLVLPGIGTVVGSIVGYMASSMIYQGALQAFEDERLSWENRDKIHAYVESAKAQLEQETEAIERYYVNLYARRKQVFRSELQQVRRASMRDDFNAFAAGLQQIVGEFGDNLQFHTFKEFDEFMNDENSVLDF